MGWVADEFRNELGPVGELWNQMRDAIGEAVQDFNRTTSDAAIEYLRVTDCRARARLCQRVSKAFGAIAVEVYLEEDKRTCMAGNVVVCKYRVRADSQTAEFFVSAGEEDQPITAEEASKKALRSFVIAPIPSAPPS